MRFGVDSTDHSLKTSSSTNTKKIELVFRPWSVLSTPNLSVHLALDTGACKREDAACN